MVEFVDGESKINVHVSHPERILFPDIGVTRRQLMDYYAALSSVLLPHYISRALTVKRWPHGITGPMFYQKHVKLSQGQSVIQIHSPQQLLQWVALGTIEWHVPLGLMADPNKHDWAVFDLDPHHVPWHKVAEATRIMVKLLGLLHIPCILKTSGHKGMHIYVKIQPERHELVVQGCQLIANIAAKTYPQLLTLERLKAKRGARVYIDYLQNGYHRTMAGVYTVRAVPRGTVSCPVTWDEIGQEPEVWTMKRVIERVRCEGDLFDVSDRGIHFLRHLRSEGLSLDTFPPHHAFGGAGK